MTAREEEAPVSAEGGAMPSSLEGRAGELAEREPDQVGDPEDR